MEHRLYSRFSGFLSSLHPGKARGGRCMASPLHIERKAAEESQKRPDPLKEPGPQQSKIRPKAENA